MPDVPIERLSFFVSSAEAVPQGWRFRGEPGFAPQFWARPGDRFDLAVNGDHTDERTVDLVVLELTDSFVVVTGNGGEAVLPGDILAGERQSASQ